MLEPPFGVGIGSSSTVSANSAVVIGADEVAAQQVSVKPLRETAEQVRCTVDEAARIIAGKA